MGFFDSEWKQSPLGGQLSNYYSNSLSQPNMGYDQNQGQLLEGARAKSLDTSKNAIRNLYASMGNSMASPQMLRSLSKSTGDINTSYDQKKFDDESQYRNQMLSGAGQAAQMGQYQPSSAATFASPMMYGAGMALGPAMGQGLAKGIGSLASGGWDAASKGFSSLLGGGQGGGVGQSYPALESSSPDMFNTGSIPFDYSSSGFESIPSLWDSVNPADLFNTGFIGF